MKLTEVKLEDGMVVIPADISDVVRINDISDVVRTNDISDVVRTTTLSTDINNVVIKDVLWGMLSSNVSSLVEEIVP